MKEIIRGRVIDIQVDKIIIQTSSGQRSIQTHRPSSAGVGDLVEVQIAGDPSHCIQVLTPNRSPNRTLSWMEHTLHPRRLRGIQIRMQVERAIREFFQSEGFLETKTPLLVPCPGMETHIRPFQVTRQDPIKTYLPTSPEFAMKRLLVGGLEKIFQMTPAFRDEPQSMTHLPEFTMLEWYRAYAGYEEIMHDTERLFEFVAMRIFGKPSFHFNDQEVSVQTPWPRLRVRDLFLSEVGIDLTRQNTREGLAQECRRLKLSVLADETWDDLYFKIWLNFIEPKLPPNQAVFVTRYPASQAALAVIDTDSDGSRWARRFEVYAGGIELGNAFEELTDPVEQRQRFMKDMEQRERSYGASFPKCPMDEGFLHALSEGMPPAGGIAVGVDRMAMLFANEPDIQYTIWI